MASSPKQSSYRQLIEKATPPPRPERTVEHDLDKLLGGLKQKEETLEPANSTASSDRFAQLRKQFVEELIPTFVELVDKYGHAGMSLNMDASDFLDGGREVRFEFAFGDYRTELHGTVTTDAIAFHEVRHLPRVRGELVSGPMLRLRQLSAQTFRDFVCERLATLVRGVQKR